MIVWLCKLLCEQMPILGCIHYEWIRGLCDWAWCNYLGFSVHKFYMYVDNFKLDNLHFSSLLWALWLQPAESNVCVSWSSWASLPAKHHSPVARDIARRHNREKAIYVHWKDQLAIEWVGEPHGARGKIPHAASLDALGSANLNKRRPSLSAQVVISLRHHVKYFKVRQSELTWQWFCTYLINQFSKC